MKNLLILLFFLSFYNSVFSQKKVTFLDGRNLSTKKFVDNCVSSMIIRGDNINYKNDGKNICECFIEKISEKFTYTEFISELAPYFILSNSDEFKALNSFQIDKIAETTEECSSNPKFWKTNNKKNIISKEERIVLVSQCMINLKNELNADEFDELELERMVDIKGYCECFINKIFKEFSLSEMNQMDEKALLKREEIETSCLNENIKSLKKIDN